MNTKHTIKLKIDGEVVSDDKTNADIMNNYFNNVGSTFGSHVDLNSKKYKSYLDQESSNLYIYTFKEVSEHEVKSQLKNFKKL